MFKPRNTINGFYYDRMQKEFLLGRKEMRRIRGMEIIQNMAVNIYEMMTQKLNRIIIAWN
jgi:hypothetical protein